MHRQKWIEYGEQVKSMTLSGSVDGEGIIPGHSVVRNQGQQVTVLMGGKCWSQGREEEV